METVIDDNTVNGQKRLTTLCRDTRREEQGDKKRTGTTTVAKAMTEKPKREEGANVQRRDERRYCRKKRQRPRSPKLVQVQSNTKTYVAKKITREQ
jgi:hypothetical protein